MPRWFLVVGVLGLCAACSATPSGVRASRSGDISAPPTADPLADTVATTEPTLGTAPEVPVVVNAPPVAAFTFSCVGLACSFDASGSRDFEGPIATFSWNFGDGATDTGEGTMRSYAAAGDYTVELTVTDGTASGTTSSVVSVAPIAETVSFVDQASVSAQGAIHVVNVPTAVMPGDGMLLFFSSGTDATIFEPTGVVTGWVPLDAIAGVNGAARVWRKVATDGDAGAEVTVNVSAMSKGNIAIVAYRGTAPDDPVADFAGELRTDDSASRSTPSAAVESPSWAVSYWMHRDSSTTALTPPDGVTVRTSGTNDGGGRVTVLVADSHASAPPGRYGELTATAGAPSSLAIVWTIILATA